MSEVRDVRKPEPLREDFVKERSSRTGRTDDKAGCILESLCASEQHDLGAIAVIASLRSGR